MNNIQILVRIASDVKLEISQSGVKYTRLNVVYNKNVKINDKWEQSPHFFSCSAFGYVAEKIANHFKKGDRILINGALEQNTWTDRDGNVQSKLVIAISEVDIIEPKSKNGESESEKKTANKYINSDDGVPF